MPRATLVSTVLALAFVALIVAEQDRPWKSLQVEYRQLELARLRAAGEAEGRRSEGSRDLLRRELADARLRFEGRQEEERRLMGELRDNRHAARWAEEDLRRLQAREAKASDQRAARQRFEEHTKIATDLEQRLARLRSDLVAAESRWGEEVERALALERRIQHLERRSTWWKIPGWRRLDPSLKVKEVRPPGLFRDAASGSEQRVDRCMTCHLGAIGEDAFADQAPAEHLPMPFSPHPGDLVGEARSHPVSLFGCTVCHGGNGRATDFSRAGHWPRSAEQESEWARKWGFTRTMLPGEPILPPSLVASGCIACHEQQGSHEQQVASLDYGRRLTVRMGCAGCHASEALMAEKQGPPLGRLAAKTTREWAFHWIRAPRSFRPTTWMPHLFTEADESTARQIAEIRAIVQVLWSRPESESLSRGRAEERSEGDVETGEQLFFSMGCTGCHLLDADAVRHEMAFERLHGPNLARIGNKVDADWLFDWLRDPRSHRPDTAMPDLRLDRRQASDLVAFLMSRRDSAWEDLQLPLVDPTARDQLVLEYLEREATLAESAARLTEMSSAEKDLFLGERSLANHGCLNCHTVPGVDGGRPKAASLADLRQRQTRLLAGESRIVLAHRFSPTHVGPDYGLSRSEADALLVRLLGSSPESVAPWRRAEPGGASRVAEQGRYLLEHYNCLGCHRFEDRGGELAPDLTPLGARLRSSWLLEYLHDPSRSARRPWLSTRMPTFHFESEEVHDLVSFFAARDHEPLLMAPFARPSRRNLAVGRAIATMLQCDRCHQDSPDIDDLSPEQLAPSYVGVRSRLRPEWVVEWILDPQSRIPGTGMPSTFAKDEDGEPDGSYLTASIAAPMFQLHRARLLPLFDSEADMMTYLADSRQVAEALRDYLWSLEE